MVDPDRLGIFSKRVSSDHLVQAGDRIEIYRPLMLDPMEARRRRIR
jgi:putative ubiquitin-RnfH superfamily antitoxin RatB of RatAB toxin-antitoxin module